MDTTKAFERRRKLSAIIWVTLAVCTGLTVLQTVFSFSLAMAATALVLGALTWSERRACAMFAQNDPRGGSLGFWNQFLLGVLGGGYLFWSAAHVSDLRVQLVDWNIPDETADMVIPLVHSGYMAVGAIILTSQVAIALFDLRVAKFARTDPPETE